MIFDDDEKNDIYDYVTSRIITDYFICERITENFLMMRYNVSLDEFDEIIHDKYPEKAI